MSQNKPNLNELAAKVEKLIAEINSGEDAYYVNQDCADFVVNDAPALVEVLRWRDAEKDIPGESLIVGCRDSETVLVKTSAGDFITAFYRHWRAQTGWYSSETSERLDVVEWQYIEPSQEPK